MAAISRHRFVRWHNIPVATTRDDPSRFSILPAGWRQELPLVAGTNLLIAAGFVFLALIPTMSQHWTGTRAWISPDFYRWIGGGGVFTCAGYTLITCLIFHHERRRGPWLVYDKALNRLALPRMKQDYALEEIDCLMLLREPVFQHDWEFGSAIRLSLKGGPEPIRILNSLLNLKYLVTAVAEHTPVPVTIADKRARAEH